MLKKEQFLPAVTTTKEYRGKIKEIDELSLERVALFPTFLSLEKRKELYELLEKTTLKKIPFCHLRSDMEIWELDYLIKRWDCKVFNIHTEKEYPLTYDYSKYKKMIYIENVYFALDEKEIKEFAGVCLDISHLESERVLRREVYQQNINTLEKFQIGCNHISAVIGPHQDENNHTVISNHTMCDLSNLDYLKNYPEKYFSQYCAIELENSLKEQLKAINYIVDKS